MFKGLSQGNSRFHVTLLGILLHFWLGLIVFVLSPYGGGERRAQRARSSAGLDEIQDLLLVILHLL